MTAQLVTNVYDNLAVASFLGLAYGVQRTTNDVSKTAYGVDSFYNRQAN
jgi:hypothetical protein